MFKEIKRLSSYCYHIFQKFIKFILVYCLLSIGLTQVRIPIHNISNIDYISVNEYINFTQSTSKLYPQKKKIEFIFNHSHNIILSQHSSFIVIDETIYHLYLPVEYQNNDFLIPIGTANIEKEGKDTTIVTYSIMLQKSLEAVKILEREFDLNVEVIDLQSLRPIDQGTIIESIKKTNRMVIVEESWPFASIGSEIVNIIQKEAFDYMDSPIIKVNSADVPMPYSSSLEKLYLPQVDDIVKAVKAVNYIT